MTEPLGNFQETVSSFQESGLGIYSATQKAQQLLSDRVAKVSPALYAAGARSVLTKEEANYLNNWAEIKDTHENLMGMNNDKAAAEFEKLNPNLQTGLKLYFNIDYKNKPKNSILSIDNPEMRKIFGADDGVNFADIVKSPFKFLMAVGGLYGKYLNTPLNAIQDALFNDASLFSRKTWERAYDGNMLYDESAVNPLIEKYGGATSFVAMNLLAGKTPAEIIAEWGPNDGEILKAINQMFNEQEAFSTVLDEFGNAQLSPGRDIARLAFNAFNIDPNDHPKWFDNTSGALDFAWQIFADPLTYLTLGGSAVIRAGAKADDVAKLSKYQNAAEFFADPVEIKNFTEYANRIGKYADEMARGDNITAGITRDSIKRDFAKHGSDADIEYWREQGVTDFESFKSLFVDPNNVDRSKNFQLLQRGLTADKTFYREHASFTRYGRQFAVGAKAKISEFFTGKPNFDALDKIDNDELINLTVQAGSKEAILDADIAAIDNLIIESTGNRLQKFIFKQSRRHPGNKAIRINDDNVKDTVGVFRDQLYFVFEDKMQSEMLVSAFLNSSEAHRFAMKKTLDVMTMRKLGMDATPAGKAEMDAIIKERYGGFEFGAAPEIKKPAQWERGEEAVSITGPLYAGQIKSAIAPLPWRQISERVAANKIQNLSKKDKMLEKTPDLIGGAYNAKVTNMLMDKWSYLTLVPTLGIRTIFDEGFAHLMTMPFGQLAAYRKTSSLRQAKTAGNVLTAYSGDLAATGPVKNILQIGMQKLRAGESIGAVRAISSDVREQIVLKRIEEFSEGKFDTYNQMHAAIKSDIFDLALNKYGENLTEANRKYLRESLDINPNIIKSASSSNIVNALVDTNNIYSLPDNLISVSQKDKLLKDLSLEATGEFDLRLVKEMDTAELEQIMFANLRQVADSNAFKVGNKVDDQTHPFYQFLKNNGLKTKNDFDKAVMHWMQAVGFDWNGAIWTIGKKEYADVKRLLDSTRQTVQYADLPIAQQAEKFITDVFTDLYTRFHGSHDQFNAALLNKFNRFRSGRDSSFTRDLESIDINTYRELVKGNYAKGTIFTDLVSSTNIESWFRKFGQDKGFEAMSRQVDDVLRQPLVHSFYLINRNRNAAAQAEHLKKTTDNIYKQLVNSWEAKSGTKIPQYKAEELLEQATMRAENEVTRFWAEVSMQNAADRVLKYSDNPDIRTAFAWNVKTVGRFYRAVEDFHRRMYRLVRENGLGTIYRLRLMSQGMSALGAVHTNEDGEDYMLLPMDDVIYGAVNSVSRVLTGNNLAVDQPLFNNFTFKITGANPSFQTDAGMPYLSGPVASLSVMGVKSVLGLFNPTKNFAEDIDTLALGSLGDNPTIRSSVVPKFVNNLWKMLSPNERDAEEVSAYTQAISYYQANGYGIDPNDYLKADGTIDDAAFDEAKRKYLADVKIAAHNIIVMRSLLGMILPVSVQRSDTKDLPKYLLDVGTVSIKESFYTVYDEIKRLYPDVEDPYELALATWMGDNPGKVVYTVSTSDKDVKPVINYTNEMQNWTIDNLDAVKEYGAGALIFAPNIGEFNPGVWKWAQSAGITDAVPSNKTVQEYISSFFDKVMLKQSINEYYKLNDQQAEALKNVPFNLMDVRRSTVDSYQLKRKKLLLSTPGLENYLQSGADNSEASTFIESAYAFANSQKGAVDPKVVDLINQSYKLYNYFMDQATQIDLYNYANGADMKRSLKNDVINQIQELIKRDSTGAVKQYFEYGLLKLMTSKSRDVTSGINRNK